MYRLVLLAGWAIVSLLAVAGFAAFSASPTAPEEATTASTVDPGLGRTAGAVAALGFSFATTTSSTAAPVLLLPDLTELEESLAAQDELSTIGDAATVTTTTAAATPSTQGIIRSRYMSEVEVRALVSRFFQPADVTKAVRIAWCESSFNPRAVNPSSGASGLFQHLPGYWEERSTAAGYPGADIFDPEANVAVAAWLVYEKGGWSHWTCKA